jgi:hypothetical protein
MTFIDNKNNENIEFPDSMILFICIIGLRKFKYEKNIVITVQNIMNNVPRYSYPLKSVRLKMKLNKNAMTDEKIITKITGKNAPNGIDHMIIIMIKAGNAKKTCKEPSNITDINLPDRNPGNEIFGRHSSYFISLHDCFPESHPNQIINTVRA